MARSLPRTNEQLKDNWFKEEQIPKFPITERGEVKLSPVSKGIGFLCSILFPRCPILFLCFLFFINLFIYHPFTSFCPKNVGERAKNATKKVRVGTWPFPLPPLCLMQETSRKGKGNGLDTIMLFLFSYRKSYLNL